VVHGSWLHGSWLHGLRVHGLGFRGIVVGIIRRKPLTTVRSMQSPTASFYPTRVGVDGSRDSFMIVIFSLVNFWTRKERAATPKFVSKPIIKRTPFL